MSVSGTMDFPYPDGTPGADFKNNGGRYLRNLTEANLTVLKEIQQWVTVENINLRELCVYVLHDSLLLLRYLRANNFNPKKTKKQILKTIEWRRSQNISELMKQTPEQIMGCQLADLMEHFPHWHSGFDKTGRPLLFKQQGAFEMKAIKALCGGNFDRIIRYHVWEQELISRVCYEQSLRTHTIIETITVVLDVRGMTMSSISSDFRTMMSAMIKMDQDMYPETLGKILIVNAPSVFPMIWAVMKPWFDPITAAKVTIKGTEFQKNLHENVGEAHLPVNYAGTLPALTKDIHPYAEAIRIVAASTATIEAGLGNMKVGADTPVSVFTSVTSAAKVSSADFSSSDDETAAETETENANDTAATSVADSGAGADSPAAPAAATGGYKQREFIY